VFGKKWSWPEQGRNPAFIWRDWGKPRTIRVRTYGAPAKIRTKRLIPSHPQIHSLQICINLAVGTPSICPNISCIVVTMLMSHDSRGRAVTQLRQSDTGCYRRAMGWVPGNFTVEHISVLVSSDFPCFSPFHYCCMLIYHCLEVCDSYDQALG
jgi:hypothetical protein